MFVPISFIHFCPFFTYSVALLVLPKLLKEGKCWKVYFQWYFSSIV